MPKDATTDRGRKQGEFPPGVKRQLAAEAGHTCSNPHCLAPTDAEGETAEGVGTVGVAAHISGAAKDSPRWDERMEPGFRKSAGNGIWMCATHAREIDVDSPRFTVGLLHRWKRKARQRARNRRGRHQAPPEARALIRHSGWVRAPSDKDVVRGFVVDFLNDTGARFVWAELALDEIRMALHELILNAGQHGGASQVQLRARGTRIDVVYVGTDFNPLGLLAPDVQGRGGAFALKRLTNDWSDTFSVIYMHNGTVATVKLVDVEAAGAAQNPCGTYADELGPDWEVRFRNCSVVHVFAARHPTYSDISHLRSRILAVAGGKEVVLHGLPAVGGLAEFANQELPGVRLSTTARPAAT
jgi:hypothetical protein